MTSALRTVTLPLDGAPQSSSFMHWPQKAPTDVLDYSLDITAWLGDNGQTVKSWNATPSPASIFVTSKIQGPTGTVFTAVLSGGTDSTWYNVTFSFTFSDGTSIARPVWIFCEAAGALSTSWPPFPADSERTANKDIPGGYAGIAADGSVPALANNPQVASVLAVYGNANLVQGGGVGIGTGTDQSSVLPINASSGNALAFAIADQFGSTAFEINLDGSRVGLPGFDLHYTTTIPWGVSDTFGNLSHWIDAKGNWHTPAQDVIGLPSGYPAFAWGDEAGNVLFTSDDILALVNAQTGTAPVQAVSNTALAQVVSGSPSAVAAATASLTLPLLPTAATTANCTLWLSADQGVFSNTGGTVPATSGQTVAVWNDRSGNGNNAFQPTAANRPTYGFDSAGFPVLQFNGSSQAFNHPVTSEPACIIAVHKLSGIADTNSNRSYCIMHCEDTSGSALGAWWMRAMSDDAGNGYSTRNFLRVTASDTAAGATYKACATSQPVVGAWDIFGVTNNGSAISTFKGMQRCGTPTPIGAFPLRTPLAGSGNGLIGVALYNKQLSSWYSGSIAEIIMFSTVPSAAEFNGIVAYLQQKYAVTTAGTSGGYVWPCFVGTGTNENGLLEGLTMLRSSDSLTWNYRPVHYVPRAYHPRDMSMIAFGGQLLLAHSTWTGSACPFGFDMASSTDGFNFYPFQFVDLTHGTNFPTAISGGASPNLWAPEWVVNDDHTPFLVGGLPVILGSLFNQNGNVATAQYYLMQPTDATFTTWNCLGLVAGLPTAIIDGFIRYDRTRAVFTCVICNSQRDSLWQSSSLLGPYSEIGSGTDPHAWSSRMSNPSIEGMSILRVGNIERVFLDNDGTGYYTSDNTSITAGGWSTPTKISAPFTPQHGTPMPVSACGGLIV